LRNDEVVRARSQGLLGVTASTAVAALVLAAIAAGATPRLTVQPKSIARGGTVTVSGRGCLAGDLVYLISPPFVGHAFVSHSVSTRARSNGSFSRRVRIRTSVHAGRYLITARCGGANLGVSAALRVY
jgi:hypothetical protein